MRADLKIIIAAAATITSLDSFAQLSSRALYFDGINDRVNIDVIDPSPYQIGTGDFTIEAWIRDDATPGVQSAESILSCFSMVYGFIFLIQNGHPTLYVNTGAASAGSVPDVRDGQCHHIAMMRQSVAIYCYFDGVFYNTFSGSQDTMNLSDDFSIGAFGIFSSFDDHFKGLIKEIRFWNTARTQSEIQNNMNTHVSTLSPGLIGYWACTEGYGTFIADLVNANYGFMGDGVDTSLNPQWSYGCPDCIFPSAQVTPGSSTTFCSGGSVTLNAVAGANKRYQWKKGGVNISGATASSYTATTGGNYKVTVTNYVTGCSKTSVASTVVTVNQLPAATITPQGPTSFCAGGSVLLKGNSGTGLTYKWKKNGAFISGVTTKNYTASTAGTYKIQVTNSPGCSKISTGVPVTVPCKNESESINTPIAAGMDVNVYPNPSPGDFIFNFQNGNGDIISISVYDVTGRMVASELLNGAYFTIYGSQLVPGIYQAVIIQGESKKVLKFVKTE